MNSIVHIDLRHYDRISAADKLRVRMHRMAELADIRRRERGMYRDIGESAMALRYAGAS